MGILKTLLDRIHSKRKGDHPERESTTGSVIQRTAWFPGRKSPELRPTVDTQSAGSANLQERDIVVGLDLGTSCTKVVIQDSALRIAYAVDFSSYGYEPFTYLVPTQLRMRDDDSFSLNEGSLLAEHLKINLMENPLEEQLIPMSEGRTTRLSYAELAIAYIALVLQLTRGWFLANHGKQYRKSRLVWQVNIGMPSSSYDDAALVETFRLVALAGWIASARTLQIRPQNIGQAYQRAEELLNPNTSILANEDELHPDLVNPVPEVVGEIEGYAKSPMRRESTHLLIDVGATTLDVAGFNLHQVEDADNFSILWAEVQKLGVYELHKHRLSTLESRNLTTAKEVTRLNEIAQLPDLEDYGDSTIVQALKESDREFLSRVKQVICRVVDNTKTRRNPNADVWKKGLPVFLCGGGSHVKLYQQALAEAHEALSRKYALGSFAVLTLPQPDNMRSGKLRRDYHRLAVAYGLSFPFLDLGKIVPPSECEDVPDNLKPVEHEYISKDAV